MTRRGMLLGLMFASGAAGLGYQVVWTQQCALWLGHEAAAVLAVVAAFFGGLALGAAVVGPLVERARAPARAYAACEAVIATWSLVLVPLFPRWGSLLLTLTGPSPSAAWQWSVAFLGTVLALLPATAAMGATLPAAQALTAGERGERRSVAGLYAANTAGAVVGVLAIPFLLAPRLGLSGTSMACAAINLACAAFAMRLRPAVTAPVAPAAPRAAGSKRLALLRLFVTGFLGIAYEVLVVRVLGQVTEQTVFTFALLLAVYLVASALGAAAWQRRATARSSDDASRLLPWLAAACGVGFAALYGAGGIARALHPLTGASEAGALCVEAALGLLAFGPACGVMGAVFASLADAAIDAGATYARALAANTAGGALAPLVAGVAGIPLLGPKGVVLLVCLGYLLLAGAAAWRLSRVALPLTVALAVAAVIAPRLAYVDIPPGGRVVEYRDGVRASVSVVADAQGDLRLRIDDRQQEGSSATLRVDGRQAWLPLLLHRWPHRVLFLGLGTGVTSAAAAERADLDVTAIELLPEVVDAAHRFDAVVDPEAAARRHVRVADARRFVRTDRDRYDVIVADNFHPARSGAGALYTVEHFEAVRARLAPGGLFCQWLPLHQLDLDTTRSIVAAFLVAWPRAQAVLANNGLETPVVGLIGRGDDPVVDPAEVRHSLASGGPPRGAGWYGFDDEYAVLGSLVAGASALRSFAAGARVNTDDLPVVAHGAPRATYAPGETPADRLLALVAQLHVRADEIVGADALAREPALGHRLEAYWRARDRFLAAGRGVRPSRDVRELLSQVESPLLDVLRVSADFHAARDPLLRMADALSTIDPSAAQSLRTRIASATSH